MVSGLSKMQEYGDSLMSVETRGAVEYWRYGESGPLLAAASYAAFTSSTVTSRASWTVRSVSDPVATGARTDVPSSLPFRSGITSPIARAAPVDVGTR